MGTKRSVAVGMAALLLGCSGTTEPDVGANTSLLAGPTEVVLALGERVQVTPVLRISFTDVLEESRCPTDAFILCAWEGNAEVELTVEYGRPRPLPVRLNTALDPRTFAIAGVRITLLEVLPVPRTLDPIAEDAYSVKLLVEPTE